MCVEDPFRESVLMAIRAAGIDEDQVEPMAEYVTRAIRDEFGGQTIYVASAPRGAREDRQARNGEIRRAHRQGMPRGEICRRWRISQRTFYRIIDH